MLSLRNEGVHASAIRSPLASKPGGTGIKFRPFTWYEHWGIASTGLRIVFYAKRFDSGAQVICEYQAPVLIFLYSTAPVTLLCWPSQQMHSRHLCMVVWLLAREIRAHNLGAVELKMNQYIDKGTLPMKVMGDIDLAAYWR
ncbi:hypothetical protein FRC11_003720, partial [Ceratobasidium sp. 423]